MNQEVSIRKKIEVEKHRMAIAESKTWLSVRDLSLVSGLSHSSIHRYKSRKAIKYSQAVKGGKIYFHRDDVSRLMRGENGS